MSRSVQEEQLLRIAKIFGNGAHIFVPKDWVGEQIVLTRQPRKSLRNRIIDVLEPHLENILGAYLYGSYARDEQREDSDIDLFIITNKKLKIKENEFEILCVEEKMIEKVIKLEPLLLYSILSEAKTIINSKLLDELKGKYKPKFEDFKDFFESSRNMINVNREFLGSNNKFSSGDAVPYSLVLRLRGLFIIMSLLNKSRYSNKEFRSWISKNIPQIEFEPIYRAYIKAKNDQKYGLKIKVADLYLLLEFLNNQILMLENGKKKKLRKKIN